MAKKRITKQTDVVTETNTHTNINETTPQQKEVELVTPKIEFSKINNFRLSNVDQANLQKIIEEVYQHCNKKLSKTLVIRALLSAGCKMGPKKILKEATAILKANVDLQLKA